MFPYCFTITYLLCHFSDIYIVKITIITCLDEIVVKKAIYQALMTPANNINSLLFNDLLFWIIFMLQVNRSGKIQHNLCQSYA
ncbi:MAG: hypothetical protein RIR39_475 [Pseudomonadota bacterium]